MHILLSNDDGYQAPGLKALLESTKEHGEITIVAPSENKSGASGSLTLSKVLTVTASGERCFAVDGTPVDCVHIGLNGLLDNEPDMVISGINSGSNLGDDVLYSGTVGAALEGRRLTYPGVAVSLAGREPEHYRTAGLVISALISSRIASVASKVASCLFSLSLRFMGPCPDRCKSVFRGPAPIRGRRTSRSIVQVPYGPSRNLEAGCPSLQPPSIASTRCSPLVDRPGVP